MFSAPRPRSNTFRLGLFGYPHAGKTTFAKQFCDGFFSEKYTPHISLEVYKGRSLTGLPVMLYEVPGQSQYIELYDVSVLALNGLIFVYSDFIEATYRRLDYLIQFCERYALDRIPGLVVCNTAPERPKPTPNDGPEIAQRHSFHYMEMDLRYDRDSIHAAVQLFLH